MAAGSSTIQLSPTLQEVSFFLGARTVSAERVIREVLERHASDYAGGRAAKMAEEHVAWPANPRTQPVQAWFREVAAVLSLGRAELHGRLMILGLALADRAVGRACVRAGLFATIRDELRGGLDAALSGRGRERLATIPLAAIGAESTPITFVGGPGFARVALSPDGRRAAAFGDMGVTLWNLATMTAEVARTPRPVRTARFGPDRHSLVAVLDDWSVSLWPLERFDGPGRVIYAEPAAAGAALSRDGSIVVFRSPSEAALRILDTASGSVDNVVLPSPVERGAVSPAGDLLAALSGDVLHVVVRSSSVAQVVASVPVGSVTSLACGAGQVIVAQEGSVLVVYGPNLGRLPVEVTLPSRLSYEPGIPMVAVAHPRGLALVHTLTGALLAQLPGGGTQATLTFSGDGRRLVSFDGGEARVWDVGVRPPPAPAPAPTYAADVAGDEADLLGRSRDVEAFASLIAAKTVEAPLSIGIFGDWGSGKSWFMRQLRARIAEMAAEARASGAPQREVTFYKHIAQVEFNAWHYAEADVLASLVEHIFGRLDMGDDRGVVAGERARRLTDLAQAEREASEAAAVVERKAAQLAALEHQREEKERLRAAELAALEASGDAAKADIRKDLLSTATEALAAVGWERVPDAVQDLSGALASARDELSRTNALLAPLVQGPPEEVSRRRWWALVQLGAGPAAGLLVGGLVALLGDAGVGALAGAGSFLAAGLAGASRFVGMQTRWVQARRQSLETAQARIDRAVADQLAGLDAAIVDLRKQEAAVRREVDKQQTAYDSTKKRVEEKRQELAKATPERLLEDLISATVRSGQYRQHLGVVAQARRDFEKVSDMIRAINADLESASAVHSEGVGLNRIVLYIDDLDRCEPDKVAKVLQAVHLLLALPLFVVVVGVDSRWVAGALHKQYPGLLDRDDGAHDYLEKIFQIPFRLGRLDPTRAEDMLRGLAAVPANRRWGPPEDAAAPGGGADAASDLEGASTTPAADTAAAGTGTSAPPVDLRGVRDLNPLGLRLQNAELEAMAALGSLIGRSPRRVKRFLNVYRLIKVRAPEPLDFVDPDRIDSDHLVVAYLLAEATGRGAEAAKLFDKIRHARDDEALPVDGLPAGFPTQCGPYKRWLDEVERFSFLDGRGRAE